MANATSAYIKNAFLLFPNETSQFRNTDRARPLGSFRTSTILVLVAVRNFWPREPFQLYTSQLYISKTLLSPVFYLIEYSIDLINTTVCTMNKNYCILFFIILSTDVQNKRRLQVQRTLTIKYFLIV